MRAGLTAAGGLLQALIALAVWPLGPFRPERAAVADAYDALADFVDGTVAGKPTNDRIPALAAELTKARVLLDDTEGRAVSNTAAGEAFRTLMIEADRLYPEVVALGHVKADLPAPAAAATQDALAATAEALRAVAGELDGGLPASDQVESLRHRLRAATITIGTEGDGPGPQAAMRLEAIRGQLRAAADAAVAWERPRAGSPVRRAVPRRPTLFPHDGIAVLRANLNLQSTAFRHALRLGVTLAVAVALYRILPVPRGYWIPLTVAFVMRPDFGSTFSRGAQRYAGTVVGAVAATALTAILDPGTGRSRCWSPDSPRSSTRRCSRTTRSSPRRSPR